MNVTHRLDKDILYIAVEGRIDASNANEAEKQIFAIKNENEGKHTVLDADKLMAANKNPDLYPDLVVRVTGFTAYFVSLTPEFRQLVVDRFLNGM